MSNSAATELDILSAVISPNRATFEPDVARTFLKWKFPPKSVARMNRLAKRNGEGNITPEERDELERFIRVGSLINLIQAKARLSLRRLKAE